MGTFTSLLASGRREGSLRLNRETIQELVQDVYPKMIRRLRGRFRGGATFENELGEDLANEIALWLIETEGADLVLPNRVIDSRTFLFYLCDKGCKRAYDRWKTRHASTTGRPILRGGSALVGRDTDAEVSARTFAQIPDSSRPAGPAFDDPDAELTLREGYDEAIGDLAALDPSGEGLVRTFMKRLDSTLSIGEFAKSIGISPATAYRHLDLALFCVMRRLGYGPEVLRLEFKDYAERETRLQELGRTLSSEAPQDGR